VKVSKIDNIKKEIILQKGTMVETVEGENLPALGVEFVPISAASVAAAGTCLCKFTIEMA